MLHNYRTIHFCLLTIILVQVATFSKQWGLEEYVYSSVISTNAPQQAQTITSGLYFVSNAIIDYFAFLIVLNIATKTSLRLAGVFVASIGLHVVGFIGFSNDVVYFLYPYLAKFLLVLELLIVASAYNGTRLHIDSRRHFIGIYDRGDRVNSRTPRKAG